MMTNAVSGAVRFWTRLLLAAAVVLALATGAALLAQAPVGGGDGLAFDSASVTPSASGDAAKMGTNFGPGGRFRATNVTVRQLVATAYRRNGYDERQISGGPSWIDSDRFDVVAKAPADHVFDPDGSPRQTWYMLRRLLADTFKLKVRYENKEQPAYALVVASPDGKLGPGLSRSATDCASVMANLLRGERPAGGPQCAFGPYPRRLTARAVTIPALASYLSRIVNRPVLDRTGLTGSFDLEVEGVEVVQPGPGGPSTRPSDTTRSIVEMLPDQLGLRLEESRGPVEIIVIEHAEKPAAK
jgi:uncharacterized protein (TIGR03435 family)